MIFFQEKNLQNFNKLFLNLLFIPIFFVFSYLIPKEKNLILAGAYFGRRFIGNPKYFYLYMLSKRDNKYKIFWVTRSKKIYKTLKDESKPVVYLYSFIGIWKILRANYLIIEEAAQDITGRTFLFGNFNIIESWHGTPLKNITHYQTNDKTLYKKIFWWLTKKELLLYKVILACSESSSINMSKALLNNNVKIIGYPRNDIFFNKELNYCNYKNELNLDKYNKVFLYAPTFRDNKDEIIPFTNDFLFRFNSYLKENNYILLIKNHPMSLFGKNIVFLNLSNICSVSSVVDDIQDLLLYVDVLITDYSSSMFDFCLTNKPIIFYSYDYLDYINNSRQMYYDYYREMVGPFAINEENLFNLIKSIDEWFNDLDYKNKYLCFKKRFNYYQDGKSCDRLYGLILENKIY